MARPSFKRLVALSLVALGLAAAPASGASLGVYVGAADPAGVDAYGDWLEREPTYAIDFLATDSWSLISDPIWWLDGWQGSPYHVVFSVPMIPSDGSTLAQGAAGDFDHHFTRLAQNLVAYGYGDATIRLGWEMNGNWFAWTGQTDPTSFRAYWRNAVDAMRAVEGSSFRFDWNPIAGGSFPVDTLYPGDAWVDIVGLDVYDQGWWPGWQDPVNRWHEIMYQPYGLIWHREFAAAHGKPISFPEFGLSDSPAHHGGGDNPYFVEKMYEWIGMNKEDVEYYAYFEFAGPIGSSALMNGSFPLASPRFVELFNVDPPALEWLVALEAPSEDEGESEDESVIRLPAGIAETQEPQAIPLVVHARHA